MKGVLLWAKQNLIIVICCAVIVLVVPGAIVGAGMWNAAIRTKQEKQANDLQKQVDGVPVSHTIPAIFPNQQPVEQRAEPNAKRTEWFKEWRERVKAEADQVVSATEVFNRREHKPFIEGLFPAPASKADAQYKTVEFVEALVGRAGRAGVYQQLLDSINAKGPADSEKLVAELRDIFTRERERVVGDNANRQLTTEEQADIRKKLLARRIGAYQAHAQSASVYAELSALPLESTSTRGSSAAGSRGTAMIPRTVPAQPPSLEECFAWQADYWFINDILHGVKLANTDASGRLLTIDASPVKRILDLEIADAGYTATPSADAAAAGGVPVPAATGVIAPNYNASVTGRTPSQQNGLYDVRQARLRVVVSSSKLPAVFDGIAKANLLTVTGLQLDDVDVWNDLENGYYYGDEHVLIATIELEGLYLRTWTEQYMPTGVKAALGIAVPNDPNAGGAPAPAPPPRQPPRDR